MLGNGIFIFLVALCRLIMLVVAQTSRRQPPTDQQPLVDWCFTWKSIEIWAIGMANTCTAIMSLAYFRIIKGAWKKSHRTYEIGKDRVALLFFVILFIICTVSTYFCMTYAERFILNSSYCLAVGTDNRSEYLFSTGLALCICCPAPIAIGYFIAGGTYLALLNHNNKRILKRNSSCGLGDALGYLNNI